MLNICDFPRFVLCFCDVFLDFFLIIFRDFRGKMGLLLCLCSV